MAKYIKLTAQQKDEIRRLTQLANRRIRNAFKAYTREGKRVVPFEIVGKSELQTKEGWHTEKTPLSRSVKFTSQKEYRQHLQWLRQFELTRPGIKEYTEIQREKVAQAVATSLGGEYSFNEVMKRLEKMTAPQIADFWDKFSENARRKGLQYSSEAVMVETFQELFPEDLYSTIPG